MRQIVLEFISQPNSNAAFNEVSPGLLNLVRNTIRKGQQTGEFTRRIEPETAALALVAAWNATRTEAVAMINRIQVTRLIG